MTATGREFTGVHLGGLIIDAADVATGEDSPALRNRPVQVPPAIVLEDSTPPLLSDRGPLPLPGAGLSWPPGSSGVDGVTGFPNRRVPLAYAWDRLLAGNESVGVASTRLSASSALVVALDAVLAERQREGLDGQTACLVIPNDLPEGAQQNLLDEARRQDIDAVLLWRPIASALAWLRSHGAALTRDVDHETVVGRLLAVHLGLEGVEAVWLDLILRPSAPGWLLPARKRPTELCASTSRGRKWVERAVAEAMSAGKEDPVNWRALYASPVIFSAFSDQSDLADASLWGIPLDLPERVGHMLAEQAETALLLDEAGWLTHARAQRDSGGAVVGAVVTGELASTPVLNGTLGEHVVRHLAHLESDQVLVEGAHGCPRSMLATSAAIYAQRRSLGMPTYLDSLPEMEALLEERARPIWRSLLNQGEQYVLGGETWRSTTELQGLRIPAGAQELALNVWVEPGEDVRRVKFQLPDPPRNAVPVELQVEIEPAQGQARVELAPKRTGALGARRILLDWSRAELLEGGRLDVESRYPRKCPQLQPRSAWGSSSREVVWLLEDCRGSSLEEIQGSLTDNRLWDLREALNKAPHRSQVTNGSTGPIGIYRAVDSEGNLHPEFDEHRPRLKEVLYALSAREVDTLNDGWEPNGIALGVLGYACATGNKVDELLRWVTSPGRRVSKDEATFLAGCLRDPHLIAQFFKHLVRRFEDKDSIADVTKAAGYILQWREDALDLVESNVVSQLARLAGEFISRTIEHTHGGEPRRGAKINPTERNCLVLIAFLLRRRVVDDSVLPPDQPAAREIKGVLAVAERGLKNGTMSAMGGMVQSDVLIERVIRYIERKGTGTIMAD